MSVSGDKVSKHSDTPFNKEETKSLVDFFTLLIKLDQKYKEGSNQK